MEDKEFEELLNRFEACRRSGRDEFFDVDDLCDIIDEYMVQNRDVEAVDAIRYALRLHPMNPEVLVLQARLYIYHEQWDEAEQALRRMHGAFDSSDYRVCLGDLCLHRDALDEALLHYERAVRLAYDLVPVYADIVGSLSRFRHDALAVVWAERALAAEPQAPEVLDSAAIAFSLAGHFDRAVRLAEQLVDADPYNARSWNIVGDICHDHGQYARALEAYSFALAIQPDDTSSSINIADCHFMLNHLDEARDLYALAARAGDDPDDYALHQLAVCELRLGNHDAYRQLLSRMAEHSDDPEKSDNQIIE